jgi:electron transfer flavoprotein alpha/beta subunit
LLVCFKTAYNLDDVTAEEWNLCLQDGQNPVFLKKALCAYDESALELALRLADGARERGEDAELTALTIDDELPELTVKNLFAVGYSHVNYVPCAEDLRFRPDLTAALIRGCVRRAGDGFDLILTGQQANVGDNGQTHLLTAEALGLPCVLNVTDASYEKYGLRVFSLVDEGVLEQTLTGRAVLGVGNALHPYLRVATLRERMSASQKNALEISPELLLPTGMERRKPMVELRGLVREKAQRDCRFIKGGSAGEKARLLYEACIKVHTEEALRS